MNPSKHIRILTFIFLFSAAFSSFLKAQQADDSRLKLWYNQPAGKVWENALPVGNGRLGAMVYGNVEREILKLNEHTLWSGGPYQNDVPETINYLAEIRQLIFDGKHKAAENLANKVMFGKKSSGQIFQPAGNLELSFPGQEVYQNYHRELDLGKAVAKTSYTVAGVSYTRTTFAAFGNRVIMMRLTASKPGKISFSAAYTTPHKNVVIRSSEAKDLMMEGISSDHEGVKGKVKYQVISQFKNEGGTTSASDSSITVKGADAVTVYISIATNFNNYLDVSGDAAARASAYLEKAMARSYARL